MRLSLALCTMAVTSAHARPIELTHQMRLTDATGQVVDGSIPLGVSLWMDDTSAASGDLLWRRNFGPTQVEGGYVAVTLDQDSSGVRVDSLWFAHPVFLEVTVDGDALGPRVPISNVPFKPEGQSCETLHARGETNTGTYSLDLDGSEPGGPVSVHCDMTTDGGGWTAVYVGLAANEDDDHIDYIAGTRPVVNRAEEMMFAYMDTNTGALINAWSFPLPEEFRAASPMAGRQCGYTGIVAKEVASGNVERRLLRYGYGSFSDECDEGCSGTYGQICLKANPVEGAVGGIPNFPFYSGYGTSGQDYCALSTQVFTATLCSATRQFAVFVR